MPVPNLAAMACSRTKPAKRARILIAISSPAAFTTWFWSVSLLFMLKLYYNADFLSNFANIYRLVFLYFQL